jgi:hypothetical protein
LLILTLAKPRRPHHFLYLKKEYSSDYCIGGSWFVPGDVPGDALRAGDLASIGKLSNEAAFLAQ